ncbi:MAG: hypothetical protein WD184_00945 [Acidimicrobiia bacterium]
MEFSKLSMGVKLALVGGIGFILIVLRFVTESDFAGFGLYLGIIASALVTYGAFRAVKEAGLQMPGMGGGGSGSSNTG